MKYTSPLDKSGVVALYQEMMSVYDPMSVPAWLPRSFARDYIEHEGMEDLQKEYEANPTKELSERYREATLNEARANKDRKARLMDLIYFSIHTSNQIAESIAWWHLYDSDRQEFVKSYRASINSPEFHQSKHYNNLAFRKFVGGIEDSISRLYAFREKVAAAVNSLSSFCRADGSVIKLKEKPFFKDVLEAAQKDLSKTELARTLDSHFNSASANSLIIDFRNNFIHGLTPSIDFSVPKLEYSADTGIIFEPQEPGYRSEDLIEMVEDVWKDFVCGTGKLYVSKLI